MTALPIESVDPNPETFTVPGPNFGPQPSVCQCMTHNQDHFQVGSCGASAQWKVVVRAEPFTEPGMHLYLCAACATWYEASMSNYRPTVAYYREIL